MKSKTTKIVVAATILTVCLLAFSGTIQAGATTNNSAGCYLYSDGHGYCSGTRGAFRGSSDSTMKMIIQKYRSTSSTSANRYFYLYSAATGSKYVYVYESDPEMAELFDQALMAEDTTSIYVSWDTSGQISAIQLYDNTAYNN